MTQAVRNQAPLASGAVSYLEWTAEAPAMHFAHATGFNSETYRGLLQPLSGSFHVFASDARGHGFTKLETRRTLARGWRIFGDDLRAFLTVAVSRPAILVGHSMGAVTSLLAAALVPQRVRGLVLIEPVLFSLPFLEQTLHSFGLQRRSNLEHGALRRRERFESREAVFSAYCGRGIFASWPDEMLRDYVNGGFLEQPDGTVRLACAPEWEAQIYRSAPVRLDRLAQHIGCPMTLLHGGKSNACSEPQAVRFAKAHGHTRRICVSKASHFLPMEYPELVRDEIRRMVEMLDLMQTVCPGPASDGDAVPQAASFIAEK